MTNFIEAIHDVLYHGEKNNIDFDVLYISSTDRFVFEKEFHQYFWDQLNVIEFYNLEATGITIDGKQLIVFYMDTPRSYICQSKKIGTNNQTLRDYKICYLDTLEILQ